MKIMDSQKYFDSNYLTSVVGMGAFQRFLNKIVSQSRTNTGFFVEETGYIMSVNKYND